MMDEGQDLSGETNKSNVKMQKLGVKTAWPFAFAI